MYEELLHESGPKPEIEIETEDNEPSELRERHSLSEFEFCEGL